MSTRTLASKHRPNLARRQLRSLRLPVLAAALLTSGCPGGTLDESFQGEQACAPAIFERSCSGTACHTGPEPGGGVDLISAGVEERVLALEAEYPDLEDCPDPPELIVDPNNVEGSLLLTKLTGTHACGLRMPVGSRLDDSEVSCIREWIREEVLGEGSETGAGGGGGSDSASGGANSGGGGAGTAGGNPE